ncbi:hypothetical protein AMECASPLE_018528 [Ameca splendens]|uniref:Uncharacterized protein n=1 Tax=Ameca splendens TaxID=208324 RepID=A0ABV0XFS1_9TELE
MQSEALRKIQTKAEAGISREGGRENACVFHREQEKKSRHKADYYETSRIALTLKVCGLCLKTGSIPGSQQLKLALPILSRVMVQYTSKMKPEACCLQRYKAYLPKYSWRRMYSTVQTF